MITTSNFYLQFKENNENDMAAQVFWTVFHSSRRLSQIGPTADFNGTSHSTPIFSISRLLCESTIVLEILSSSFECPA